MIKNINKTLNDVEVSEKITELYELTKNNPDLLKIKNYILNTYHQINFDNFILNDYIENIEKEIWMKLTNKQLNFVFKYINLLKTTFKIEKTDV